MKALGVLLICVFSFSAFGEARSLVLEGRDADVLIEIFADVAQNFTAEINKNESYEFKFFRPGAGAFTLDCVNKITKLSSAAKCEMVFDPLRSDAVSTLREVDKTNWDVFLADPQMSEKIQNRIPRGEYWTEAKAPGGEIPRLKIGCVSFSLCSFSVAWP